MIELLAAAIIGVALLWLVVQPILAPSTAAPVDLDPLDPEETPRGQALLALKEIEFDRATGKLSEPDYAALKLKYSAAAIAALDAPVKRFCANCGTALHDRAIFCAECGERVSR